MAGVAQEFAKPAALDSFFDKQTGALASSLEKVVQSLLGEYERLKQTGQKSELTHIYLSFLFSGVLCKTPLLRVDLCDEKGWDDMAGCGAEWDIPFISDKLYRDADEIARQRGRIKDYELERLWLAAAEEFAAALERVLPAVIAGCAAAGQCGRCTWHYGQYLGATVTVGEKTA